MKLTAKVDHQILAENVHVANHFFQRLRGWMGKRKVLPHEGLLLQPCNSIHTFFMKIEIDACFLDADNHIVFMLERIKPYSVSPIIQSANKILELQGGRLEFLKISIGNTVTFNTNSNES